ncbi:hypothetical protein KOR42_05530 [Thalassoglobus neptunius]|uniref:Uncharacterized protein n=1 Tax=Thalassoglobus neptunius TaxID=1938619 RepID=A0A5C5X4S1_9PLAN|nr:hypothetical protein [Thalassoglobus neptunius]TWT57195.1 hypothetical protein KOR42_05530 [Thalassoglobus neptunius]
MRRLFLLLTATSLMVNGCTMMQWLAPHQLWKLNRQPAISRDDAYFSIPAEPVESASDREAVSTTAF